LALAGGLDLGLPPGRFSPLFVTAGIMLATELRLDVLAIAAYGPAEPIGTLLARRRPTTNLRRRPDLALCAARTTPVSPSRCRTQSGAV